MTEYPAASDQHEAGSVAAWPLHPPPAPPPPPWYLDQRERGALRACELPCVLLALKDRDGSVERVNKPAEPFFKFNVKG